MVRDQREEAEVHWFRRRGGIFSLYIVRSDTAGYNRKEMYHIVPFQPVPHFEEKFCKIFLGKGSAVDTYALTNCHKMRRCVKS
jgi:hypothetical protein